MENPVPAQSSIDVKLDYIQRDVREMKTKIDVIQNDFVSRREYVESTISMKKEFTDANTLIRQEFLDEVKSVKRDIALPKKIMYGLMSVIALTVLGAVLEKVIK